MKHGKHAAAQSKKKKTNIVLIVVIIIIIALVSLFYFISLRNKNNSSDEPPIENIISDVPSNEVAEPEPETQESFEMVDTSDMPTEKGGYAVLGKIVIDKINVENYILNKTTNASLNLAVTWFWGPDPYNRTVNDIRKY